MQLDLDIVVVIVLESAVALHLDALMAISRHGACRYCDSPHGLVLLLRSIWVFNFVVEQVLNLAIRVFDLLWKPEDVLLLLLWAFWYERNFFKLVERVELCTMALGILDLSRIDIVNEAIFSYLELYLFIILLIDLALHFKELIVCEVKFIGVLFDPHVSDCDVLLGCHHLVKQLGLHFEILLLNFGECAWIFHQVSVDRTFICSLNSLVKFLVVADAFLLKVLGDAVKVLVPALP